MNKTWVKILIGVVIVLVIALIVYGIYKWKKKNSNGAASGLKKDAIQRYINALLAGPYVYHLQTMKHGGAHGQPGTAEEQKRETFNKAVADASSNVSTNLAGQPGFIGSYTDYNYPGIPFGNAPNSPPPTGGSSTFEDIMEILPIILAAV